MNAVSDDIWFLNWYEYPTSMQKYLVLIIRRAQIPFFFRGYKMYRCSLERFIKVDVSYFMRLEGKV